MIKQFTRRMKDWVYHSIYTDNTKTTTKRVIDWRGYRYEVNKEDSEHKFPWFIDACGQEYEIRL